MRILGIDPGYERVGIAVTDKKADEKIERLIYSDCFQTSAKISFSERLNLIGKEIKRLIEEYEPEALGIETLFLSNNQKTAMRVAEARGVILYEAAQKKITICEYSPLQIKVAAGGYGKSDKRQVTEMVKRLVRIEKNIRHDDEYDAIAVALTCRACGMKSK